MYNISGFRVLCSMQRVENGRRSRQGGFIITIRDYLSHTFHISFPGLDEAFEILFSSSAHVASTCIEMNRISPTKIPKLLLHPPKGAVGMANSFFRFLMVPVGCWS